MSYLVANQHRIGVEITGTKCTVPDNHMARLMYYLSAIDSLCDFGIPSNLTDYENYRKLSFDSENAVLCFAALLEPKIFIEKNVMVYEPSLCGNSSNEFFKISDSRTAVAATREFIIGGKQVHTLNIMAFKESWLKRNYIDPMSYYSRRLQAIADGNVDDYKPKPITYSRQTKTRSTYSSSSQSDNPNKKSRGCNIC